ncbi:hypothetical protein TWF225_009332 [Orbilia oligospora]|nr:hypothetical protein TWF225_009332 [Orbilia oligospora]KAF3269970.1 hypothetical protein TWF217_008316 [Orbilia oligospora]KAF3270433.1 hypothetical protein TWF128_004208 [Orbilia oligospora]KAF3270434.1 hypothetical protein TWF128_004208 [Orbilia oligospora]
MPAINYLMEGGPGLRYYDPREPIPPEAYQYFNTKNVPGQVAEILRELEAAQLQNRLRPPQKDNFVPPLSASIKAQVVQDTARVTVTHLFLNKNDDIIPQATYTFPLPQGCTVTDFVCHIGEDKILRSQVKIKKEASQIFRDAVQQGESAALLEQNTPEIFTTKLGIIPARSKIKVEISFIFLLKYRIEKDHGLTTFTLPVYIAPRFGDAPVGIYDALRASTSLQSLKVEVNILAPAKITSVRCDTHNSETKIDMRAGTRTYQSWEAFGHSGEGEDAKSALVCLENTVKFLDRDFILEIETDLEDSLEQPQAWVETHPDLDSHRALMLTVPSGFLLKTGPRPANSSDGEIMFLADRSGSMDDKIQALRSAMKYFLKGIAADKLFNIWCFGSDFECLWPQSRRYSNDTLQQALNYVEEIFHPNMGGTNLLPAFEAIIATKSPHQFVDIVALTDGEVWLLDETLNFVERTRKLSEGRVRFFCLGIGAAVSHALVEGIAHFGGGYAEVIPLAHQGGWESRVVEALSAASADHIGNIEIQLEGLPVPNNNARLAILDEGHNYLIQTHKMMQSPARVSDLSPFLRNRVFILFESLDAKLPLSRVHLRVVKPGREPISIWIPIKHLKVRDNTLHKLAARALLGDLEQGRSHIHLSKRASARNFTGLKALVAREGERLGCKWSLVSKWTSFVAVEELVEKQGTDGRGTLVDHGDSFVTIAPENDLDLLQHRGIGVGQAIRFGLALGIPETEQSEHTDTDDSDSDADGSLNSDRRDNNHSDDEDASGSGSGRAGAPGNNFKPHRENGYGGSGYGSRYGNRGGADSSWSCNSDSNNGSQPSGPSDRYQHTPTQKRISYGTARCQSVNIANSSSLGYYEQPPLIPKPLIPNLNRSGGGTCYSLNLVPLPPVPKDNHITEQRGWRPRPRPPVSTRGFSVPSTYNNHSCEKLSLPPKPAAQEPLQSTRHGSRWKERSSGRLKQIPPSPESMVNPDPWKHSPELKGIPTPSLVLPTPHLPEVPNGPNAETSKSSQDSKSQSSRYFRGSLFLRKRQEKPKSPATSSDLPIMPAPPLIDVAELASSSSGRGGTFNPSLMKEQAQPCTSFPQTKNQSSYRRVLELEDRGPSTPGFPSSVISLRDRPSSLDLSPMEIKTPHHNVPATSAMRQMPQSRPLSTETKSHRGFITHLLDSQDYDGSFNISDSHATKLFGSSFPGAVRRVGIDIEQKLRAWGSPSIPKIALTALVIALLETKMLSQKALWMLLVEKARGFIKYFFSVESLVLGAGDSLDSIINNAKEAAAHININFETFGEERPDSGHINLFTQAGEHDQSLNQTSLPYPNYTLQLSDNITKSSRKTPQYSAPNIDSHQSIPYGPGVRGHKDAPSPSQYSSPGKYRVSSPSCGAWMPQIESLGADPSPFYLS